MKTVEQLVEELCEKFFIYFYQYNKQDLTDLITQYGDSRVTEAFDRLDEPIKSPPPKKVTKGYWVEKEKYDKMKQKLKESQDGE